MSGAAARAGAGPADARLARACRGFFTAAKEICFEVCEYPTMTCDDTLYLSGEFAGLPDKQCEYAKDLRPLPLLFRACTTGYNFGGQAGCKIAQSMVEDMVKQAA